MSKPTIAFVFVSANGWYMLEFTDGTRSSATEITFLKLRCLASHTSQPFWLAFQAALARQDNWIAVGDFLEPVIGELE